jgi:hypothetical protein
VVVVVVSRRSSRRLGLVVVVVAAAACATPRRSTSDGGNRDLSTDDPVDLAEPPPDLRPAGDLSGGAVDLAGAPADLAGATVDMSPMCTPPVAGSPCDTAPQCGCSGGQNCDVSNLTTGATSCVAAGTTNNYAGCSTTASVCKVGASCVDGVCAPFCETNADCPGNYRKCVQVVSGSTNVPGFKVCTLTCDPTSPQRDDADYDPCGPNINCWPSTDRASYCVGPTTASGTQYVSCTTNNTPDDTKCAPGYLCLADIVVPYACYRMCRYGVANSCPSGYTCFALSAGGSPVYAGAQQIGYCD